VLLDDQRQRQSIQESGYDLPFSANSEVLGGDMGKPSVYPGNLLTVAPGIRLSSNALLKLISRYCITTRQVVSSPCEALASWSFSRHCTRPHLYYGSRCDLSFDSEDKLQLVRGASCINPDHNQYSFYTPATEAFT
jgi:hypothetical protein